VGFVSGELLGSCVFGLCCCWSVLGQFGVALLGFVKGSSSLQVEFGGVSIPGPRGVTEAPWNVSCAAAVATGLSTGLIGAGHRSDRCSTGGKPCKFPLCELVSFGSEGCVLVPRISSTPVTTWSWPT
jgi:hypothetical protein